MLVYCDEIAHIIKEALFLNSCSKNGRVLEVGRPQMDLHPTGGYFVSTKKTIKVFDRDGTEYRITVEEAKPSKKSKQFEPKIAKLFQPKVVRP